MGILLGFPLAGHFDLLGSESLFGTSQDPPMYAHTSFSQGRFHQRGQWVEYQLEYQLAPLPLDFQGAFLHVCGWRSPALNMRTMWAEPSFLLLRSTLFVLECQCTDNSRLLLAPEVHLSPASSSGLLQIALVRSPSCVRLYVTQCTAAQQASLSAAVSQSLLKLVSLSHWSHPAISSSAARFRPQSFLALRSFPMSWLFTSCGQSTGASASAQSFQWIFRIDFL